MAYQYPTVNGVIHNCDCFGLASSETVSGNVLKPVWNYLSVREAFMENVSDLIAFS